MKVLLLLYRVMDLYTQLRTCISLRPVHETRESRIEGCKGSERTHRAADRRKLHAERHRQYRKPRSWKVDEHRGGDGK